MSEPTDPRRGVLSGLASYALWGLFPLYWPLLAPAGAGEVLAHRILWSLLAVAVLVPLSHRGPQLRTVLRDRRQVALLAAGAVLIAVNWGTYIYGVDHHQVLETSLGYFVNPIVSVLLGVLVLRERLRAGQWVAVGIAAVAVLALTAQTGHPPWIALILAVSFGTYGLIKKVVRAGPVEGLVVETGVLAPAAALFLAFGGGGSFSSHGPGHAALLASTGVVTAIPLLLFAVAAARVPLYLLGVMQYLAPTLQFGVGVLVRHEPLPWLRLAGFGLVWVGLAVFTADLLRTRTRTRARASLTPCWPAATPSSPG